MSARAWLNLEVPVDNLNIDCDLGTTDCVGNSLAFYTPEREHMIGYVSPDYPTVDAFTKVEDLPGD